MYHSQKLDLSSKAKTFIKFLKRFFSLRIKDIKEMKKRNLRLVLAVIAVFSILGFLIGSIGTLYFYSQIKTLLQEVNINLSYDQIVIEKQGYIPQTSQEEAVIKSVKQASPAVVSIVISKDVPVFEEYIYGPFKQQRQNGTEKKEIGGGSGFIISNDGMILTNKHVVIDKEAEYTVFTNSGKKFTAEVLARDPVQDLAVLKIDQEKIIDHDGEFLVRPFPVANLGNSDEMEMGQTVIAIGNALGEFKNTISVGVVSGLGRTITASGGDFVEILEDVIQTDAAINKGNSGGPLINLKGEVIGINTAMVLGAQSIGFAIPINKAKRDIEQIKELGRIVYPFLGVRYVLINEKVKEEYELEIDYGAFIIEGDEESPAIWPDSAAEKAGLKQGDIILEFNGEKITSDNSLVKIISKYSPEDTVSLKYLRDREEITVEVELGERHEE